jgi:uncharacterized protein YutE (UPF0331/DUF86 family)
VTPGRVDLKVVDDRLAAIESCLADLRALPSSSLDEFTADRRNPAAAESLVRRALQSLFDLLRHLLANGLGRPVLEYKEIARAAAEECLVSDPRLAALLVLLAGYRNRMVHFYIEVTPEELYRIVHGELGDLEAIAAELRRTAARLAAER